MILLHHKISKKAADKKHASRMAGSEEERSRGTLYFTY